MKVRLINIALAGFFSASFLSSNAQVDELVQYNPNSIEPIPAYEHHYKTRVWRDVYLEEKQNKGFFAMKTELSRFVIDLIKSGEIEGYKNEEFKDTPELKFANQELKDLLLREEASTFEEWNPSTPYEQGNIVSYNGKKYSATYPSTGENPETAGTGNWEVTGAGEAREYDPREVSRLQILEDMIFDKRRGRLYYDIQGLQLIITDNETGAVKTLGWFKYKDLEKMFRKYPEKAVWVNRQNYAQNKNFGDAFLLRLFHGYLSKFENPDDMAIVEMILASGGNRFEGVYETYRQENLMMEKEHNLWEY